MEVQTSTTAVMPQGDALRGRDEVREDILQRNSNISLKTLLATDYLNHFNEIVMTIDLAADMPDMFDLTESWAPLDYSEHFQRSNLSDRDLAVEAYLLCAEDIRTAFDGTVGSLNDHLVTGLASASEALKASEIEAYSFICRDLAQETRNFIDRLSAIIHGSQEPISVQESLDAQPLEDAQQTIDCLFST